MDRPQADRPKEDRVGLCRSAAESGATAVALTDHGVMYGAMEFYYAARDFDLTPILGCEAYLAPRGRFDRSVREEAHLTLLAADLVGYRNLVALVSKGFLEGYYYKPRDRSRTAGEAQRRPDRPLRVHVRDGCRAAAQGRLRRRPAQCEDIPRDIRRPLLHRSDAPRDARAGDRKRGLGARRARARRAAGRYERFALPRAEGRRGARRPPLHWDRQDRLGYEPDEVLLRPVLSQIVR